MIKYFIRSDKIYFFDDNDEPKLHAGSGILRKGQPKPSWYALRQIQQLLGDARLEKLDEDGGFYAARWRKPDGATWLMLWSAEADSEQGRVVAEMPALDERGLAAVGVEVVRPHPVGTNAPDALDDVIARGDAQVLSSAPVVAEAMSYVMDDLRQAGAAH